MKLQLTWTVSKWQWYEQIPAIRARFEALRHEPATSPKVEAFLKAVETDLHAYRHPDPYMFPYYEGGTKFQRNSPPPQVVLDGYYHDFVHTKA